jgi:hypothetical protein
MNGFLKGVLGDLGFSVLSKAMQESEKIAQQATALSFIAWFEKVNDWKGELPGEPGTDFYLQKSENVTGVLTVGDQVTHLTSNYRNELLSLFNATLDDSSQPLFTSIQKLVKVKIDGIEKAEAPEIEEVGKVTAASYSKSKKPKSVWRKIKIKMTPEEMKATCPTCMETEFKNDKFVGCICLRDLANNSETEVIKKSETFDVVFGDGWDEDAISVFLEIVGK